MPKAHAMIPLPLDLDDRHLFGAQDHLQRIALTTLDERGWSKEGSLFGATCYRARGMLKSIREDILAIALGHNDRETSVETLLYVQ